MSLGRRNGLALLRLGQAKLALGQPAEAISTLTDCIELFPRDEVVFQARLECARAHMEMVQYDQAEKLLMEKSGWRFVNAQKPAMA